MLNQDARQHGIITASTGNHGQALALAAQSASIPITVFAPTNSALVKLDAIRAYGEKIELVNGDGLSTELEASKQAVFQGKCFISPYNDKYIIAGQGTFGIEMIEQQPDLDAVFVSVGGGGLISGVGGIEPGAITFALCQQVIDRYHLVNELDIRQAMRLIARTDRWMIECAAAVAAAMRLVPEFKGKKLALSYVVKISY